MANSRPPVSFRVVFDKIPELRGAMRRAADEVVRDTAFAIEARAKGELAEGHGVDTGAMRASIYTATDRGSDYGANVGEARGRRPGASFHAEEERPAELTAVVAVAAEYGIFVHEGARGRAGIPFLESAAEAEKPGFVKRMKEICR